MPALHDFRNCHGYPVSCCEHHGMDSCNQGRTCPARKPYAPPKGDEIVDAAAMIAFAFCIIMALICAFAPVLAK